MDVFEAIEKRYSHKVAFDPQSAPSRKELEQIVQAGIVAPSGMNAQSCEFIIVTDKEQLKKIAEIVKGTPLKTAPAMIAVVSDTSPRFGDISFYKEDYSAAIENMLLAAIALGYSAGWIDAIFHDDAVRLPVSEVLGLPADRLLTVIMPIGKPGEAPTRRGKKPFEQRASWDRYSVKR